MFLAVVLGEQLYELNYKPPCFDVEIKFEVLSLGS